MDSLEVILTYTKEKYRDFKKKSNDFRNFRLISVNDNFIQVTNVLFFLWF